MAVLDATMERRPPFNPSAVVAEAAVLLRNYACTSIVGDSYGQEWVVDAFAQVGIRYVKSERDRNEIYLNALPLFTNGRIKLLDDRRLVSQFASLERRVLSSGREKVEPGADHDDLANSSSIALTLAGADAEPVLIKYPHFLNCGKPLPEAPRYYHRFLSMAVSQDGKCAIVWWACFRDVRPQLIMEDFQTGYFSEPRFAQYGEGLGFCYSRSSQHRVAAVVDPGFGWGISKDDVISDFSFLAIAASYVESGTVKVTQNVHDKSQFAPINDALDFRYSRLQDALPCAVVAGVFRGLHEA